MRFPRPSRQARRVNAFVELRQSRIHGRGLFARRKIPRGVKLLEYRGERVDKEESNRRGLELFERAQTTGGASVYIFDVNEEWDLDGDKPYNFTKYANHSCAPNCEMVNEDDRLWLYTTAAVKRGEELVFDYGYDIEHYLDHPCRCGAPNCVGFIVSAAQRDKLRRRLARTRRAQQAGR